MYTIRLLDGKRIRNDLRDYLTEKGIMTKIYFDPVHLTSFYRRRFGYKGGELPNTERIADEVLTLPMYPSLTTEEMDYIIECVKEFFEKEE